MKRLANIIVLPFRVFSYHPSMMISLPVMAGKEGSDCSESYDRLSALNLR